MQQKKVKKMPIQTEACGPQAAQTRRWSGPAGGRDINVHLQPVELLLLARCR